MPILLIASNAESGLAIDQVYRQRIGPVGQFWHLPDAGHTDALKVQPARYVTRVISFLQQSLGQ